MWRGIAEGLNAVMVNPSVVLGPGDWKKGSNALLRTVWENNKFCLLLRVQTSGILNYLNNIRIIDTEGYPHEYLNFELVRTFYLNDR